MTAEPKRDLQWIGATIIYLGLGSLGPLNVYYLVTDPHHLDSLNSWGVLILPFGIWLLTGFLLQGSVSLWLGGIKRNPDWAERAGNAWDWWCRLGLWLLGIGIVLVIAVFVFSGAASYVSTLDKGTALIAFLLFMILCALWRIGDQMKRR